MSYCCKLQSIKLKFEVFQSVLMLVHWQSNAKSSYGPLLLYGDSRTLRLPHSLLVSLIICFKKCIKEVLLNIQNVTPSR